MSEFKNLRPTLNGMVFCAFFSDFRGSGSGSRLGHAGHFVVRSLVYNPLGTIQLDG